MTWHKIIIAVVLGILSIAGTALSLMISSACLRGGSVSWTWRDGEPHYLCRSEPITIKFPGGLLELQEREEREKRK